MTQITSHVDWAMSAFMIAVAVVHFAYYTILIWKHKLMAAVVFLGMAFASIAVAAGVSIPKLLHGGIGIASLPVISCFALGAVLAVVGAIGVLYGFVLNNLPRIRGDKHSTATVPSHS